MESDKIGQDRLAAVGKACTPEAIEKAAVQFGWLDAMDTNRSSKRPVVGGAREIWIGLGHGPHRFERELPFYKPIRIVLDHLVGAVFGPHVGSPDLNGRYRSHFRN